MTGAKWIRFVHSQEQVKEILDYCEAEKKKERGRILDELDYIEHVGNIHEFESTCYIKDVRKIVRGKP